MPADFVNRTFARIRDGELEVLGVLSIDGDSPHLDIRPENGGSLTRDEHYAVTLMLHRGRLVLFPTAKNFYEIRPRG